jgi:hypothetical protein
LIYEFIRLNITEEWVTGQHGAQAQLAGKREEREKKSKCRPIHKAQNSINNKKIKIKSK